MIAIETEIESMEQRLCEECRVAGAERGMRQARGFPSPAENYVEGRLEIGQHLVRHPTATYFARMIGNSMVGCGIAEGDLLVIDRSEAIGNGHVIVLRIGEEMLIRKIQIEEGRIWLSDGQAQMIELTPEIDYEIWGRVIHSVRRH